MRRALQASRSLAAILVITAAPASARAQAPVPEAPSWRADLEAGYRAQGLGAYRGYFLAPGFWFQTIPRLQVGVLAPLHLRTSESGRAGLKFSVGVEPRLRYTLRDALALDLGLGFAAERHAEVEGVTSFSLGIQIAGFVNLRYTHERYSLGPNYFRDGGTGDGDANFLEFAFSGRMGQRLALAEAVVFVLLAAVTSGAR